MFPFTPFHIKQNPYTNDSSSKVHSMWEVHKMLKLKRTIDSLSRKKAGIGFAEAYKKHFLVASRFFFLLEQEQYGLKFQGVKSIKLRKHNK